MQLKKRVRISDVLILLSLLSIAILQIGSLQDFRSLPSPLYGGDYYFSMGCVNHILIGGNWFDSCHLLGERPHYFPIYPLIVAGFVTVTGLSVLKSMILLMILFTVVGFLLTYCLIRSLTNNPILSVAFSLLYISLPSHVLKGTNLENFVMIPALFLVFYFFFQKQTWNRTITLGLIAGLNGLTSSHAAPILGFSFFGFLVYWGWKYKQSELENFQALLKLCIAGTLGLAIMSIIWIPNFSHWGERSFLWISNADATFHTGGLLLVFKKLVKNLFFDFNSVGAAISSIALLLSISLSWKGKFSEKRKYTIIIFLSMIIMPFFYLPLYFLNISIFPLYIVIATWFAATIFSAYHINILLERKKWKQLSSIIILFFVVPSTITLSAEDTFDMWGNNAKNELPAHLLNLRDSGLLNSTSVVLSTKELSFALNALTGIKVLSNRQAHNSPFTNTNVREKSSSIILYGNDSNKRKELLKKYSVTHLYWDAYWQGSEWSVNKKGEITNYYDPFFVIDTPLSQQELSKAGISYFSKTAVPDPAARDCSSCNHWPLLYILPANMSSIHPWHTDLDSHLQKIWEYPQSGIPRAILFEIHA
ncbi:hypothetical protein GF389_02810 [Candidatus Dojkabacteria bacterium]|nr:hypothetical protein [Candidatus Dojkabacteria bacterium]